MTFSFRASSAERLAAWRTAFSAHSTLRPRICARLRMYATASFIAFSPVPGRAMGDWSPSFRLSSGSGLPPPSGSPPGRPGAPIWIGVAAPRLVPGAIAATWLAYMM